MKDDPGIDGTNTLVRDQERIDINFLDSRILNHQPAESNENPLELAQVNRFAASDSPQRRVDSCVLHHASGKDGVQRRQSQRANFEDFYQLSTQSKQEDRTELRIHTTAENQLVAFAEHGLD